MGRERPVWRAYPNDSLSSGKYWMHIEECEDEPDTRVKYNMILSIRRRIPCKLYAYDMLRQFNYTHISDDWSYCTFNSVYLLLYARGYVPANRNWYTGGHYGKKYYDITLGPNIISHRYCMYDYDSEDDSDDDF